MKKALLILVSFFGSTSIFAQSSTETLSDSELMKMDIFKFCKSVGVPADYNKRYEAIILPLCEAGKMLFDAKSNPYVSPGGPKTINGKSMDCYLYIGTGGQNETLKRNILANRKLLVAGKVTPQNAKKWKVVK